MTLDDRAVGGQVGGDDRQSGAQVLVEFRRVGVRVVRVRGEHQESRPRAVEQGEQARAIEPAVQRGAARRVERGERVAERGRAHRAADVEPGVGGRRAVGAGGVHRPDHHGRAARLVDAARVDEMRRAVVDRERVLVACAHLATERQVPHERGGHVRVALEPRAVDDDEPVAASDQTRLDGGDEAGERGAAPARQPGFRHELAGQVLVHVVDDADARRAKPRHDGEKLGVVEVDEGGPMGDGAFGRFANAEQARDPAGGDGQRLEGETVGPIGDGLAAFRDDGDGEARARERRGFLDRDADVVQVVHGRQVHDPRTGREIVTQVAFERLHPLFVRRVIRSGTRLRSNATGGQDTLRAVPDSAPLPMTSSRRVHVLTVIGARPQFVKAAITSPALARAGLVERVVLTGQHADVRMAGSFLEELDMAPPAHVLERAGDASEADPVRAMQARLEPLVRRIAPAVLLVYGDTDSTLAGAFAARACGVPLVHVEAGLRSFNPAMREERNRIETDRIAALLFAPSRAAHDRLVAEGTPAERVRLSGDVMLDLFRRVSVELRAGIGASPERRFGTPSAERPAVLLTAHRAENVDDGRRLRVLVDAAERLGERADVLWPVHPRARRRLIENGLLARIMAADVRLVEPLSYRETVAAVLAADVVCTDSGGLQKEAFFASTPCVTIRGETEWTELVEGGWNRLCPLERPEGIVRAVLDASGTRGAPIEPYGDGDACERIAFDIADRVGLATTSA